MGFASVAADAFDDVAFVAADVLAEVESEAGAVDAASARLVVEPVAAVSPAVLANERAGKSANAQTAAISDIEIRAGEMCFTMNTPISP